MTKLDDQSLLRQWAVAKAREGADDSAAAVTALRGLMRDDPAIYRAIMEPMEERAAAIAIAQATSAERGRIWNGRPAQKWQRPTAPDDRVTALAAANRATLYDMPLRGGVRLGDATRADLERTQQAWSRTAHTLHSRAAFLSRIIEKLPAGTPVRKAITLRDLEALHHDAAE